MNTTYLSYLKDESLLKNAVQVIGGSFFIALCAQISIPIPFSTVPITLQTLAILLLAGLFGSRQSALMVMGYYAQILMGFPVLAGGVANPMALIGPRAGYIFGFLVQAYFMGWCLEKSRGFKTLLVAGLFACALQLGLGALWLSQFVGGSAALVTGVYPFIPGEILKVLFVTSYLKKLTLK